MHHTTRARCAALTVGGLEACTVGVFFSLFGGLYFWRVSLGFAREGNPLGVLLAARRSVFLPPSFGCTHTSTESGETRQGCPPADEAHAVLTER